jgi:hypothetical protein
VSTTDAGQNACDGILNSADGAFDSCGQCYYTWVPPVGNGPDKWGFEVLIGLEPSVGDSADTFYVEDGLNLGGCVIANATLSHGQACGLDIMQLTACEIAVCGPLCAVPNPGPGNPLDQTAVTALENCWSAADQGACATYYNNADTDCSSPTPAAYYTCNSLVAQDEGAPDAAAPTSTSESQLLGQLCGG